MSQATKANEPSMEEILASIRRIIADDEPAKPAAKVEAKPEPKPMAKEEKPASQDDIDALLADFDAPAPPPKPAPIEARMTAPEPDILELTEPVSPPKIVRPISQSADLDFVDEPPPPPPPPPPPAPIARETAPRRPFPTSEIDEAGLLSSATNAAVGSAFGSLAHTILSNNARTLEDLVKEMLRPMLKSWLDDNLPHIVERLVRAEIERVSRGAQR